MKPETYDDKTKAGQVRRLRTTAIRLLRASGEDPRQCRVIAHQHNTTFRVVDVHGRTTFLRVSRICDRSPVQIEAEMHWLQALANEGHPVATPILWADGNRLREVHDPGLGASRVFTRFEWCPGKMVSRPEPWQWRAMGAALARLHIHTERNPSFGQGRWTVDQMVGNNDDPAVTMRDVDSTLGSEARRLIDLARSAYEKRRAEMGPIQLIHGDLHQHNVLVSGDAITLIDFDDCGFAPALYDFVVPIREMPPGRRAELTQHLVDGYREVRSMPGDLAAHLPLLLCLRTAQLIAWIVGERHNPSFAPWWETWTRKQVAVLREELPAIT